MKKSKKIINKIKNFKKLPSLPQVLLKLIDTCNSDDPDLKKVSKIISQDPSLSVKVLQLVNSAYMGLRSKIYSIEKATVYLGLDAIMTIAISASVQKAFSPSSNKTSAKLSQFWWHSIMCALVAKKIAVRTSYDSPDEAFLAGLLHDLGKLVLWVNYEKKYAEIEKELGENSNLIYLEEEKLGVNHCEVGAWLVHQWKLKSFMADAVFYHHEAGDNISDAFPLVKIVYAANALCLEYDADMPEKYNIAEKLFGFSNSQSEEMLREAMDEAADVAQSLGIQIESPSNLEGKDLDKEYDKYSEQLLYEVKNYSLLYGTLQNLLKAKNKDTILKIVGQGLQILFDIRKSFFFFYDPENDLIAGYSPRGDHSDEMIANLAIPLENSKSLISRCFLDKKIIDSFGIFSNIKKNIADEQLIRLLETEGIFCLPMYAHETKVGAILMGIDEAQVLQLKGQQNLLNIFVNHAAMGFHIENLKQEHINQIRSERMEASSLVARQVVHEVNNPLTIIKNYLKILGMKLSEEDPVQNDLVVVNEEIERVSGIIRQLSTFSDPQIKKKEAININRLISNIIKIIKESILKPSHIDIHLKLDNSLPNIITEKNSIKQVLINLLKNSAEAMPGGGNIFVETKISHESSKIISENRNGISQYMEIIIRDDGPGIPVKIEEHLFEPYHSSKKSKNSGLGLSIVYNIIKELKGTIKYASDDENGAIFKIALPL